VPGDRDLDLVMFGATGFVGRLTAEQLALRAPDDLRIGLAGRSAGKLAEVRDGLGPRAAQWPLLTADSTDSASLDALARGARVVVSTVGPYREYGLPLVEACAAAGTDYADLTGELLFVREAIDRADVAARASGARLVNSCGFDTIPSDLGVLLLHEAAQADGAGDLEDTTLTVTGLRGGFSGGTLASGVGEIQAARADPAKRKIAGDPYALSPDRASEPDLGRQSDLHGVARDDETGRWVAPFVMAPYNTRLVRRSNALLGWAYGPRFRYREVMAAGEGVQGRVKATAAAGGLGAAFAGLSFGPTRAVMQRFLPSPGEGPSEEMQRKGFFRMEIRTRTSTGARYVCKIAAQGDPGYAATAVMLAEAGLCLTLDRDRLPDRAGLLTPATAMGDVLVDRLRAAGHTYEISRA
jgi:short subunit dehydrogenase-like uncharacterized protein